MFNFIKRLFGGGESKPALSGLIVAAKVVDISKHPNADRLRVISLFDGKHTIEPVVCGAFNFTEGDIVALALPGAVIARNIHSDKHESFTLDRATIRGVESQGMICAAYEIGLSDELSEKPEIMVLPETTRVGKILA